MNKTELLLVAIIFIPTFIVVGISEYKKHSKEPVCVEAKAKGYELEQCGGKDE